MGKRQKDELPDYTVANMDVDGMPWNTGRKKFSVQDQELDTEEKEPLTKAETKAVILAVTKGRTCNRRCVYKVLQPCSFCSAFTSG